MPKAEIVNNISNFNRNLFKIESSFTQTISLECVLVPILKLLIYNTSNQIKLIE